MSREDDELVTKPYFKGNGSKLLKLKLLYVVNQAWQHSGNILSTLSIYIFPVSFVQSSLVYNKVFKTSAQKHYLYIGQGRLFFLKHCSWTFV